MGSVPASNEKVICRNFFKAVNKIPSEKKKGLIGLQDSYQDRLVLFNVHMSGAPNVDFGKISVRKTIWDLEFSEHLL